MAIDFFGVKLEGRIYQFAKGDAVKKTADARKVIDLWLAPQTSANVVDLGVLAFVSEINVKYKLGENAEISLVLTPPFEEGLVFLQSDIIRFGTGRLEVLLSYSTGSITGGGATSNYALPFSGFLQKPDVSIGSDIVITLHALGVGYQLNIVGNEGSEKDFESTDSYAEAVRKTLKKYTQKGAGEGLKIDNLYKYIDGDDEERKKKDPFFNVPQAPTVTNTQTKTKSNPKTKSKFPDVATVPGVVIKGPRNDWWFVKETVTNFGYDLFIKGDEIFICSKTKWMEQAINGENQGRKQFLLRGVVDPTRNMFPILSFQSPTTAVWLQPGIGKLVARDVDVNKQDDAGVSHTAEDSTVGITRAKRGMDPSKYQTADGSPAAVGIGPGDPADPEVQKKIEAHWTDMNMDAGIQGVFTTLGIPGLIPGESVDVSGFEPVAFAPGAVTAEGFDPIFNGVYGVIEVNHKIGVGGWETSFLGCMGFFPENLTNIRDKSKASVPTPSKGTLESRSLGSRSVIPSFDDGDF
jgi:hypothetical protein